MAGGNMSTICIATFRAVNGLAFGAPSSTLTATHGPPDEALTNYTGELELRYDDSIYRFFADRFVEATFPDTHQFVVDGVSILTMLEWLAGADDCVDKARFRISPQRGIAYDYRFPDNGSVTVFEDGRWDTLLTG